MGKLQGWDVCFLGELVCDAGCGVEAGETGWPPELPALLVRRVGGTQGRRGCRLQASSPGPITHCSPLTLPLEWLMHSTSTHSVLGALVPSAVNEAAGLNDGHGGNNSHNTKRTKKGCCVLTLGRVSGTGHVLISPPEGSTDVHSRPWPWLQPLHQQVLVNLGRPAVDSERWASESEESDTRGENNQTPD